jgi:uncharacterized small protein (DUF1192 family)
MNAWTEERHREARARCVKATPGPWIYGMGTSVVLCETGILDANLEAVLVNCGRGSGTETQEDGEFIAASRTDLPDALDEIERLQRQPDRDEALMGVQDKVIVVLQDEIERLKADKVVLLASERLNREESQHWASKYADALAERDELRNALSAHDANPSPAATPETSADNKESRPMAAGLRRT